MKKRRSYAKRPPDEGKSVPGSESFPIQYYTDNFARWERGHVPLHWHREPEFFSVYQGEVEVQAGGQTVPAYPGGIHISEREPVSQLHADR